jgi:hypothetical protein
MFPVPTLQVSADPTDSTPPAELRTPELLPRTLALSLQQDDTPIKRSCSMMQPYTTNTRCRDTTLNAMGNEIRGCLIGLMPVEEFLSPLTIPDYHALCCQ